MTTLTRQTDEKINASHGYTIDIEWLLNNYAIAPEIYLEYGNSVSELTHWVTVVDIFDSENMAKMALSSMEAKGLQVDNISIIAKGYKEPKHSLNWASIVAEGGLEMMLTKLGIESSAIAKFVEAIDSGKFLVIEIGSDRKASQSQHLFEEVGHRM